MDNINRLPHSKYTTEKIDSYSNVLGVCLARRRSWVRFPRRQMTNYPIFTVAVLLCGSNLCCLSLSIVMITFWVGKLFPFCLHVYSVSPYIEHSSPSVFVGLCLCAGCFAPFPTYAHNNLYFIIMIGEMQSTWNCVNLRELDLSNNHLTKIPSDIQAASKLTRLNLSHNKLTEMPLPWYCPLVSHCLIINIILPNARCVLMI